MIVGSVRLVPSSRPRPTVTAGRSATSSPFPARFFLIALLAVVLIAAAGTQPAPSQLRALATTTLAVDLSTASTSGNVTYNQAGIPGVVSVTQPMQNFAEQALLSCEQTWSQSGNNPTFGLNGWQFNANVGGSRALIDGIPAPPGFISIYNNGCTGKGYNESASMLLVSKFYIKNTGTGNFAGSIQIGWSFLAGFFGNAGCGPFIELTLTGAGAVSRIKTALDLNGIYTYGPPNILGAPLANQTWYTAYLWSNYSQQAAQIVGPSGSVTASSSLLWHVTSCNGAGQNQMAGAIFINNQTAGTPGPSGFFAFRDATIAGAGSLPQFPVRKGYAQFNAITTAGTPTMIAATVLVQQVVHSTGATFTKGIAGGICPCYLNASGATVWTSAALSMSPSYSAQTLTFDLTNVTAPNTFSFALFMNNTDGLSTQTISSLTVTAATKPPQPGGGPPPPPPPTYCQQNPLASQCVQNLTVVQRVLVVVCNLWFLIVVALVGGAAVVARRAARNNPGPRSGSNQRTRRG